MDFYAIHEKKEQKVIQFLMEIIILELQLSDAKRICVNSVIYRFAE